jgi:hypothetical protein
VKKKLKLINIMPHLVAAVTVITIIIACGEGEPIDIADPIKKREIGIAEDELGRKIDSLAEERQKSSAVQPPSSGTVQGESSSGTADVSSSGTVAVSSSDTEVSSSGTAGVSSSSTPPSSSSNPYTLKCEIDPEYNPIKSTKDKEFDLFDGDNVNLKNQMPAVICVKNGTENTPLDPVVDVKWYNSGAELKWKTTKMEEQEIDLSVEAMDDECSGLSATCGELKLCYKIPTKDFCLSAQASSSSEAASSSSAAVSSSSKEASVSSSSVVITYTLVCGAVPATGTAGTAITPPAVTCNGTSVSNGLTWTSTPKNISWSNPEAGTYNSISVSAGSAAGNCSGKTATCSGELIVGPAPVTYTLACTGLAATGTAGTAISIPTVKCNGSDNTSTTVNAGLTWTGAPAWTNPTAAEYNVSVSTSDGNCKGKPAASCGKITVAAANTCAYNPSWCSNIAFKGPKMFVATGALVTNDTKVNGEALPGNTEAFKTEWGNDICIFITGATKVNGGDAATFTLVNGQAPASITGLTNFDTFLKGIPTADGGYYILRKAEKWWQIENATGGTLPSCTP